MSTAKLVALVSRSATDRYRSTVAVRLFQLPLLAICASETSTPIAARTQRFLVRSGACGRMTLRHKVTNRWCNLFDEIPRVFGRLLPRHAGLGRY